MQDEGTRFSQLTSNEWHDCLRFVDNSECKTNENDPKRVDTNVKRVPGIRMSGTGVHDSYTNHTN